MCDDIIIIIIVITITITIIIICTAVDALIADLAQHSSRPLLLMQGDSGALVTDDEGGEEEEEEDGAKQLFCSQFSSFLSRACHINLLV